MNRLAEQENFIVLFPDQSRESNSWKCWNWFLPGHTKRGRGEVGWLAEMIRRVKRNHNVNPDQIYAAGFSSGAAMVPNLSVAYPDLIAAGAIHSGFQYRAATGVKDALSVRSSGGPDPRKQGNRAFEAMGNRARPIPTIVLHGTDDSVVAPINGRQAAQQAVRTITRTLEYQSRSDDPPTIERFPTVQRGSQGRYSFKRKEYRLSDGRLGVVHYSIGNMGHAWAGGQRNESYVAPGAPDAGRIIWEFFDRHTKRTVDGRVNTPPSLSLKVQPRPAVVGSTVTLTAKTHDPDGRVVSYDWSVDNQSLSEKRTVKIVPEDSESIRVDVTVRDDDGATARRERIVPVQRSESQ
jgi:poly(hydroxyalkanoate) depolymerase family esterase